MKLTITIDVPNAGVPEVRSIGADLVDLLRESVAVGAYDPIDTEDLAVSVVLDATP